VNALSQPPSGDLILQICELIDQLSAVGPLRADLLLDALAVARAVTVTAATGTTVTGGHLGLLGGLHLDLAAADIADAFGPDLHVQPHVVTNASVDDSISAAAWRLVAACARTIQWQLEQSRTERSGEQLLALTRAVLQLDAARNASRPGLGSSSWP
jgi:hypothetical protein